MNNNKKDLNDNMININIYKNINKTINDYYDQLKENIWYYYHYDHKNSVEKGISTILFNKSKQMIITKLKLDKPLNKNQNLTEIYNVPLETYNVYKKYNVVIPKKIKTYMTNGYVFYLKSIMINDTKQEKWIFRFSNEKNKIMYLSIPYNNKKKSENIENEQFYE